MKKEFQILQNTSRLPYVVNLWLLYTKYDKNVDITLHLHV